VLPTSSIFTGIWPSNWRITVNGCNLKPAICWPPARSAVPPPDSYGSMLELAWRGSKPLLLPNGEKRSFLEDGDRVTMTAWCQGDAIKSVSAK